MALGEVDYGLFGLVGGLTAFVAFINGLLSSAVGRFYAVSVGAANKVGNEKNGLEECRKWFNTAVLLHSVVPAFLIVLGYPCGEWAVRHFLTIPPYRISACVWVWRFTCASCFVGMLNVPFNAMYMAKQEIAELTIYSFVTSTLNVIVLYYMISHPSCWLVKYAFWTMMLSILPQVIIMLRALIKFPECRYRTEYLYDFARVVQIGKFAFARFWTELSGVVSTQGNAILVNKYLGPAFNASMAVGSTVAGHASTLSGSLSGAFWPVIANKVGEGKYDEMREFAFRTCRLGAVLLLIFALPLMLEIDEVMILWLKNPPAFVSIICVTVLIDTILERLTEGYWMAIIADGKGVSTYSLWVSLAGFSRLFIAWLAFALGFGIYGLCAALIIARSIAILVRLWLGRKFVVMSVRHWIRKVFIPLALVSCITLVVAYSIQFVMATSFWRVCVTTMCCELIFLPLVWFCVLSSAEKEFVALRFGKYLKKK